MLKTDWQAGDPDHDLEHNTLAFLLNDQVYVSQFPTVHDAAEEAVNTGRPLYFDYGADGQYTLEETLIFAGCMGTNKNVELTWNGDGVGIQIGVESGITEGLYEVKIPHLRRSASTWIQDDLTIGSDVGVRLVNLRRSRVEFGEIENFSIGLIDEGYNFGSQDVRVSGLGLMNNGIGLRLTSTGIGAWKTQSYYKILKYHLATSLGEELEDGIIPGTRLIQKLSTFEAIRILHGNLEGNSAEYVIEWDHGGGLVYAPRFETNGDVPARKVLLQEDARNLVIDQVDQYYPLEFEAGIGYPGNENIHRYLQQSPLATVEVVV